MAVPAPSYEAAGQPSAWFQPLCTSQPSAASALGAPCMVIEGSDVLLMNEAKYA